MNQSQTSLLQKWFFITVSLCVVSLPVYLFLFVKKESEPTLLKTLIQKTPTRESLSPRFFSDYLGLSPGGQPLILKKLDVVKIENKLKEFPIFASLKADFTKQGQLLVSYELRRPVFLLRDFSNCGIDDKGFVMPIVPFYSPKKLPEVYLGLSQIGWNQPYDIHLASQIYSFFSYNHHDDMVVKLIDLSKLTSKINAHKEIIVTIQAFGNEHYLRIHPLYIEQALRRYLDMYKEKALLSSLKQKIIFDARIKKFATLKKVNS